VFFGPTGLPVPIGGEVWRAMVVGQALIVTVTTDGTLTGELDSGATLDWAIGMEVLW
jgi:hypothetical protein